MKNFVLTLIAVLAFAACNDDLTEGEENALQFNTETTFKSGNLYSNNSLSVKLDAVLNDSRCPSDVQCVWEGNAMVKFVVSIDQSEHEITLNTNGGQNFPSDTLLQGYSIQLTELVPYPESTSTIHQEDYEATIVVKSTEK